MSEVTEADLERRAQAIFNRRKARTDEQIMASSRMLAEREMRDEQRRKNRADRGFCSREAERRGLQLVCETWKGAPVGPDLAFRPNPAFVIDDKGVHVITVDQSAAFVCSPVVQTGPLSWAVKRTTGWTTVDLEPGNARNDLDALVAAGLRVGSGNVVIEHPTMDTDNSTKIAVIALEWLFRRGPSDEIVCIPASVFSLWDTSNFNAAAVGGLSSPLSPKGR